MKNIILTGAKGNLGASALNIFLENGYHVTGTVSAKESVSDENANSALEYVSVDLTDTYSRAEFAFSSLADSFADTVPVT